jgi:FemAB-related protein (PEP-CTERM system-associated)
MKVCPAQESDSKPWDDYIAAHPDGFFCQTTSWRQVVKSVYGHSSFYLIAQDGSTLRGVLPLILIESRLFGRAFASSPFASAGAVCASDDAAATALVQSAIELSREHRVDYLELKSLRPTPCDGFVRYTGYSDYQLRLDALDTLWRASLDKGARAAVRQAERLGLTSEHGHHCLPDFYQVMAVSMRRLGTPMHSRLFYEKTLELFGEQANFVLIRHGSQAIAGALLIRHGNLMSVLHTGSLSKFLRLRPNNLLYWEIIKQSVASGAAVLEMGRSLPDSGIANFKQSFGAVGRPLCYEYFLAGRKTLPQINQANPRFALGRWAWQRMHMPVTKWLGPKLISSIP